MVLMYFGENKVLKGLSSAVSKVRKGVLFAKRTPFREKNSLYYEKEFLISVLPCWSKYEKGLLFYEKDSMY